jgi:four helix bundle protein
MATYEKIEDRTYRFALQIVRLAQRMPRDTASRTLGQQVLRSGTSIGANVEEAIGASSRRDFIHKMAIANKEARETYYWLRLIRDAKFLAEHDLTLLQEALELKKILSKTVSTSRQRLRSGLKN